jgi:precorrin-3B methylase
MAAITTQQEYDAIREALQLFSQGQSVAQVTQGDLTVTYQQSQMEFLEKREHELARRLSVRNVRKRTFPDFDA